MNELDILRDALRHAAGNSHDPRTQCGAVLRSGRRLVYAANVVPPGVDRFRPGRLGSDKYSFMEHAERAAIYKAAAAGVPAAGATLYAPWFACCDCARAIILAGVVEVVGLGVLAQATPERWREAIAMATEMLTEAGVNQRWITDPVGATILFDGRRLEC